MNLKNNTILVTGGTSGIGLELAAQLSSLGNTVLITGRDRAKLDRVLAGLPGVFGFVSDVADPQAIAVLFREVTQRFPDLNVLVNNAGEMRRLDLLDPALGPGEVQGEIDINLSGPVRMVQQFLPHLRSRPSGAIINVTSGLAFVPFPLAPVYSATKAGLRAYTRALRIQLERTNLKVFELAAPGARTPLNDKFAADVDEKSLMDPRELVAFTLHALAHDRLEIVPGLSQVLRTMGRWAPGLILEQFAKGARKGLR